MSQWKDKFSKLREICRGKLSDSEIFELLEVFGRENINGDDNGQVQGLRNRSPEVEDSPCHFDDQVQKMGSNTLLQKVEKPNDGYKGISHQVEMLDCSSDEENSLRKSNDASVEISSVVKDIHSNNSSSLSLSSSMEFEFPQFNDCQSNFDKTFGITDFGTSPHPSNHRHPLEHVVKSTQVNSNPPKTYITIDDNSGISSHSDTLTSSSSDEYYSNSCKIASQPSTYHHRTSSDLEDQKLHRSPANNSDSRVHSQNLQYPHHHHYLNLASSQPTNLPSYNTNSHIIENEKNPISSNLNQIWDFFGMAFLEQWCERITDQGSGGNTTDEACKNVAVFFNYSFTETEMGRYILGALTEQNWRYYVTATDGDQRNCVIWKFHSRKNIHSDSTAEYYDCEFEFLLVVMNGTEYLNAITDEDCFRIRQIKMRHPNKKISIVVVGLELAEMHCPINSNQVSNRTVNLQLDYNVRSVTKISHSNLPEFAEIICKITELLSQRPHRLLKKDGPFFSTFSDARKPKSADDKKIWIQMLQEIRPVKESHALAIASQYPNAKSLLDVYSSPFVSMDEKKKLLEPLLTSNKRPIGKSISIAVFEYFAKNYSQIPKPPPKNHIILDKYRPNNSNAFPPHQKHTIAQNQNWD